MAKASTRRAREKYGLDKVLGVPGHKNYGGRRGKRLPKEIIDGLYERTEAIWEEILVEQGEGSELSGGSLEREQ